MSDLTKGEIFREAQEKIKPITNEVESHKKKLIENAAVIISLSVIVLSIILYAFNKGYCSVFNLPTDVMSLDMTRLLPLAFQILSIASFILLYVSSLKAERALKKNRINFVRILWGFFIVAYFFSVNNVPAVMGNWMYLLFALLISLLVEMLICFSRKPTKVKKVTEAEHQMILEDTVQDAIFATYYIRYGIFLVVLPFLLAPDIGEFRARAEREYQTCTVQDTTYAVVCDYEDKVLVQRAVEQDGSLWIDTSGYSYFEKKDIILRYSKYDSVSIGPVNETEQLPAQNSLWIKIKEVFSVPSITDWLMVVITFVYVIATILICGANIRSAKAAREQIAESKRQYDEDNRAFVTNEIIYENRTYYGLRFVNHGKRVAMNVRISLKKEFIDSLTEPTFANFLRKLEGEEFLLGIGQSYSIYFGGNAFRDNLEKEPIEGTLTYSDGIREYTESIYVDFNLYPTFFSTSSDTEKLIKKLGEQNKELELLRKEISSLKTVEEADRNA